MRTDPNYESEEMETNLENLFDHVNEMSNTDMPRDFLASLSKHFFRENGEKFSTFQKLQTEACLLLEQRQPHWRKRKSNSASQFLSILVSLLSGEVSNPKRKILHPNCKTTSLKKKIGDSVRPELIGPFGIVLFSPANG